MQHTPATRVLILSESPEGFGHFNVTDQLSNYLQAKGATVGLASGSLDHAHASFKFASAQEFALPGVYSACPEPYDIATGKKYEGDLVTARKARMREICETFHPDVIVSELYPFKDPYREHDIEAAREWMRDNGRAVPVVTLCRDLIRSTNAEQVLDQLARQVDTVLVRGDGTFGRLEDSMPEWKHIAPPVHYTGNIVSPMPPRRHPPSAQDPVVVFGGGGYKHDPEFGYFCASILGRAHAGPLAEVPWDIYVSQHCPGDDFAALQNLAKIASPEGKIRVQRVVPHAEFQQALSECSAAITRGGYNTCFELAAVQKPFVIVPRPYEFSDQTPRAKRMAELGYCSALLQQDMNPERLGQAIAAQHAAPAPTVTLDSSGLAGSGDAILEIARNARRRPLKGAMTRERGTSARDMLEAERQSPSTRSL